MVMQTVTLDKIVPIKGRCYGPGTIEVSKDIADVLVKYHGASTGELKADDPNELGSIPADRLTPDQLMILLEAKQKQQKAQVAKKTEAAKKAAKPVVEVVEGGQAQPDAELQEIMDMSEAEILDSLKSHGVEVAADVTEKAQMAVLLAEAVKAKQAAAEESEKPKPANGQLPAGFPGRAKLFAAGLTTIKKLKAAKQSDWPKTLDTTERDTIKAELALSGTE